MTFRPPGGGGITPNGAATFTNKVIDSEDNTLVGIEGIVGTAVAVDLTSAGAVNVFDCSALIPAGYQFIPTKSLIVCTAYDAPDQLGAYTMGTNNPNYDDLDGNFFVTLAAVGERAYQGLFTITSTPLTSASDDIFFNVGTPDGGTAYDITIQVMGYFEAV